MLILFGLGIIFIIISLVVYGIKKDIEEYNKEFNGYGE